MTRRVTTLALLILALNTLWFVAYSAHLGLRGLTSDGPEYVSRVFVDGAHLANFALATHMVAGALLTVGAPLQALPIVRTRWRRLHRCAGYVLFGLSMATAVGGLLYIALEGTIGGAWMSFWFAIYGLALLICASKTVENARAGDHARHHIWATRLIVLAVGSWIYRMHYAIWQALTGGLASNPDFTGLFDRVQVFAFFVPYLLIAKVWIRLGRSPA